MAATLHDTSVFCVDFQLKNLLGVAEDKEDHVLITCRGVVKRCDAEERRQVQCWTAKSWHPFTSAAVYHPASDTITAAISGNTLIQWTHTTDDIDKVKKLNFETSIYQLFVSKDTLYVLFSTGQVEEVTTAIKTRKEVKLGFLTPDDTIKHAQVIKDTTSLVLVVEREKDELRLCKVRLSKSSSAPSINHPLAVDSARMTGVCVLSSAKLITLWSTGEMYTFDLESDCPDTLPGQRHVKENLIVATKNSRILELSPSHIVVIGLDKQDEGGLMVLRDLNFAISISVRKLKMYHNPPLAWVMSRGVVVAEGASLAIIPFTVQESNLATVFATKVSETHGLASEMCHSWIENNNETLKVIPEAATKNAYFNKSSELCKMIRELDRGSISESLLSREVIKLVIEKRKLQLVYEAVDVFVDIPECSLVDALIFYLQCQDMELLKISEAPHLQMELEPLDKDADKIVCPFTSEKAHLINGVLHKPFTEVELVRELSRLTFDNALALIQYLHYLIASGQAELNPSEEGLMPSLCQAGVWLGLLLDTNYHQLVMSSEVAVHRLLLSCFDHTTNMRKFLEDLLEVEPLLDRVVQGSPLSRGLHSSAPYSLERLVL